MTMHKSLHSRDDVDSFYVSIKGAERGLASIEDSVKSSILRLDTKASRKTDNSHQKQYRNHEDQQNDNNQKTKIGRKTTLWTF